MKTYSVVETALASASIASAAAGLLAQIETPGIGIAALITQFGGLGFAIWLVYYHTTKTIPEMMREHREERAENEARWVSTLDAKRREYMEEMKAQREASERAIDRIACKYSHVTTAPSMPPGPWKHPPGIPANPPGSHDA
jgi:hypothetical protein